MVQYFCLSDDADEHRSSPIEEEYEGEDQIIETFLLGLDHKQQLQQMGKELGDKKMEDPHSPKSNEIAQCSSQLQQPLVCDTFKNSEGLCEDSIFDEDAESICSAECRHYLDGYDDSDYEEDLKYFAEHNLDSEDDLSKHEYGLDDGEFSEQDLPEQSDLGEEVLCKYMEKLKEMGSTRYEDIVAQLSELGFDCKKFEAIGDGAKVNILEEQSVRSEAHVKETTEETAVEMKRRKKRERQRKQKMTKLAKRNS